MISLLPAGSVLRIPFDFNDGGGYIPKLFVVLGHRQSAAVSLKATSKLERYGLRPETDNGIVYIPAGAIPFTVPTVIDPSNAFAIPHRDIVLEQEQHRIEIWTAVVDGLVDKLRFAILNNPTLPKQRRLGLLGCLDSTSTR